MTLEAILTADRGSIVAPAGCGKTHLITDALQVATQKPYLVLTHTTAGVAALKQKLKRLDVKSSNFVISTVDGWALRVANMFPISCSVVATLQNPGEFYPELRKKVNTYLESGSLEEVIRSSYSRVLVDEYQDCDALQHELVCSLANVLPTIVFGDPLQCIFNFGGPMPSWNNDVITNFPLIDELSVPWRWINAGAPELGEWVLSARHLLLLRQPVDLMGCPNYVHWNQLTGNPRSDLQNQIREQYRIRNDSLGVDSLLVIGDSRNSRSRHHFASTSRGVEVVEPVDLTDVISTAASLDISRGWNLAEQVLTAASSMMTGVGLALLRRRIPTILAGRNRSPATDIESAVQGVIDLNSRNSIANLLNALECSSDTRVFRRGAFSAMKNAVSLSISDPSKTIRESSEVIREQRRHLGEKRIPTIAIGSTLLLKGLEADHSLILDADEMNHQNLYVALSRGAKSVTVFSRSTILA